MEEEITPATSETPKISNLICCTPKRKKKLGKISKSHCTAVYESATGDIIVGSHHGRIEIYDEFNKISHSCKASGAVWSICEQDNVIYAQCGDCDIQVWSYDLKRVLNNFKVDCGARKIAVARNQLYISQPSSRFIAKYSANSGAARGDLRNQAFVEPLMIRSHQQDSIVVCDGKAHLVFLFKNDAYMWQINIEECGVVASHRVTGCLWVKQLNSSKITILDSNGEYPCTHW